MPGPAPVQIDVDSEERAVLESWTRSKESSPRQYIRAKIVLLADEGMPNAEIARKLDYARDRVVAWRKRFATERVDGLLDRPRSGRPSRFSP